MGWPISASDVRAELGSAWPPAPAPPAWDPLAVYATAAVERIEAEIGPRSGQSVTATVTGPRRAVTLPWPVASLTQIEVDGADVDLDDYDLDGASGIVLGPFPRGRIVVTAAAPATAPTPVELAARYLAATWVRQSRVGPPRAASRADEPDGDVLQGFAMPRRVSEMIRPYVPVWGFA